MPAEAALVRNLERDDYVAIVCGSLDRLAEAFAELDRNEQPSWIAMSTSASSKASHSRTKKMTSRSSYSSRVPRFLRRIAVS
jgi:hypothetical protein